MSVETERVRDAAESLLSEVDALRRSPHAAPGAGLYIAARDLRAALNGDDPAIAEHRHEWSEWQPDAAGMVHECYCGAIETRPWG